LLETENTKRRSLETK